MDLATAIREGSKIRPQTWEAFFDKRGSCALGAAYEGLTGRQSDTTAFSGVVCRTLGESFPMPEESRCPDADCVHNYDWFSQVPDAPPHNAFYHLVAHLNDDHRWTRERIADWLDTL